MGMLIDWLQERFGSEPHVELIPWTDAHSGNFDDDQEAYTLVVNGDRTNISFAIEETEANAPDYTKVDMTIPEFVAEYGVEIEDGPLGLNEDQ